MNGKDSSYKTFITYSKGSETRINVHYTQNTFLFAKCMVNWV